MENVDYSIELLKEIKEKQYLLKCLNFSIENNEDPILKVICSKNPSYCGGKVPISPVQTEGFFIENFRLNKTHILSLKSVLEIEILEKEKRWREFMKLN